MTVDPHSPSGDERHALLSSIVSSSDDAIVSKTLAGIITSWNPAAQKLFGHTEEEAIGRHISLIIPKDRMHEEEFIISKVSSGQKVDHFETIRVNKSGEQIHISVTVSPIFDSNGKIIGASKIARDISIRKQLEAELEKIHKQLQKELEVSKQLQRQKDDFIGMVSHELKTPLTSINALIQVANKKLQNSEDPFLAQAMGKAAVQVRKMSAMINGFLNVSRLEVGKIILEKSAFDIRGLIADIIDEIKLTATSHEIIFAGGEPCKVVADEEKIGSVITNLVNNAVKYSPKAHNVEVNCTEEGSNVIVSVKDQGIGIPAEDVNHVFDRYYRVENTDTKNISGFGIGLYLSAEIIREHGGKIWVESVKGQGSTFYFSLPLE
ncbi:sensor histidine kinase [Mucilaginibacter ginkgonis]|uniref:histidine kinase n=1 Tax=Mucilaginibacter ginkgonis TaxID=2682091 RepID=A0A7T7F9A7_9SPHI|nr:ATP-binding protein [Mucilaginibacter ginkgonis]QQL49156.1 PAS domain S-box protein [Mucilaginibacter ginkgonis]